MAARRALARGLIVDACEGRVYRPVPRGLNRRAVLAFSQMIAFALFNSFSPRAVFGPAQQLAMGAAKSDLELDESTSALLYRLERFARAIAPPLLSAPLERIVDKSALDEAIESKAYGDYLRASAGYARQVHLLQPLPDEPPAALVELLGEGAFAPLVEGQLYAREVVSAWVIVVQSLPEVELEQMTHVLEAEDHFAWLWAPGMPNAISMAHIATHRATAALLALAYALHEGQRVDAARATLLAHETANGFRECLRVLASVPITRVPEEVIPLSERYNLDELVARAKAFEASLNEDASRMPPGVNVWFPNEPRDAGA